MTKDRFKRYLDEKNIEKDLNDYFGPIFAAQPEEFTFTCGDKKMIQQIAEYVQIIVQKRGYGYFKGEPSQCTQNAIRVKTNSNAFSITELQEKLFNSISDILQPYGKDLVSLFKIEMVIVTIEKGIISGGVHCVLCDNKFETETNKKKRRTEYYSQYWNSHSHSWSISNFANHHLRKVHPIHK